MLASQPFDPQKQPPISNRELFLRRLRLIKILGCHHSLSVQLSSGRSIYCVQLKVRQLDTVFYNLLAMYLITRVAATGNRTVFQPHNL